MLNAKPITGIRGLQCYVLQRSGGKDSSHTSHSVQQIWGLVHDLSHRGCEPSNQRSTRVLRAAAGHPTCSQMSA